MPTIKLKAKAQESKSGFEPYDGPTPTRKGFYRAVIKKLQYRRNSTSKSMGFYIVVELEAQPGDPKGHAMFDGYPMFISSIITETADGSPLKEGAQRNLENFLAALGTGDEPSLVLEDGDPEDGVDVKKVGNVNPIGRAVNIDVGFETYMNEQRPKAQGVYKFKQEDAPKSSRTVVDTLIEEEDDESDLFEGDDNGYEERKAELEGVALAELKSILKSDYDLPSSGTKPVLVERILAHEFPEDEEPEDEEEPEDGDDEPEEDETEDEAEDDEAEEDEEEEDEDDEAYNARVEELNSFDRAALKAVLKSITPDFTVLKRHTDDQLREQILANEFGDELPF